MAKLVRSQRVNDQVLSVLRGRTAASIYEGDDKIPPERTLAEEFGVSCPSVKVALNVLIARQVLGARQGDGYYVSVKPQRDSLRSWQELLGKRSNWEIDVFDFSCHIEGYTASLAAERHTDADLKHTDFWRQKFESTYGNGHLEHQTEADVSLHQATVGTAYNILFGRLSGGLLKILYCQTCSSIIYFNQTEDPRPKLIAQHRTIYEAISERRFADTAEVARIHLSYIANSIL